MDISYVFENETERKFLENEVKKGLLGNAPLGIVPRDIKLEAKLESIFSGPNPVMRVVTITPLDKDITQVGVMSDKWTFSHYFAEGQGPRAPLIMLDYKEEEDILTCYQINLKKRE